MKLLTNYYEIITFNRHGNIQTAGENTFSRRIAFELFQPMISESGSKKGRDQFCS